MVFKIFLESRAKEDLIDTLSYYESKSLKVAEKFYTKVEETLDYLIYYAYAFEEKRIAKYEIPIKGFPYSVVYEIDENVIHVLSIFNTHQNPTKKP
ncbi:hypothetical protein MNBD_BACTEROID03-847 [hydrothermal vent metagenome]|uniref:Death on curing protein, Doc toxin n=1 Tax=hydrothermal vent metagenome TaxID=652676 RepID=A0A3B0TAA6_9ZZZZ